MKRFPDANVKVFVDEWPNIRTNLNIILRQQYQTNIQTIWPADINDLFILLKLIPGKSNGRYALTVQSFNKAIDKLIVFRTVS